MTIVSELRSDIDTILSYGEQVRFKYYNTSYVGDYDDDVSYAQSGTDYWVSGLVMPINAKFGGYDSLLLQQGKITLDDKKLYVNGEVQTSGLAPIKIGMTGSPPTKEYEILGDGQVIQWHMNGSPIYKKCYIRMLNSGSFVGE